jgi:hypothetical protein
VLEWAQELGEFCGLLRFVYLYFLAGVDHCYAYRLRTIADQLLDERKTAKGRKLEMTL